jgi:hypothetical protein
LECAIERASIDRVSRTRTAIGNARKPGDPSIEATAGVTETDYNRGSRRWECAHVLINETNAKKQSPDRRKDSEAGVVQLPSAKPGVCD